MRNFVLLLLTVAVANASVSITRTSSEAPHPSTMELEVTLPNSNEKVLIPLERTDAFENIPMTVIENGVSRTFSAHQAHDASHAHYRDIQSRSVISVRQENGNKRVSGHVMHEGTSYFLEPVGESDHRVVKNLVNPEVMAKKVDVSKLEVMSRKKRQTNTSPTAYTVEIQLLLDDTIWSGMKAIFGDDTKTLSELHIYYTHILNGIDTTYRNIPSLSISIECIGITIAKTASDSKWMPASLDGSAILSAMAGYIVGQTGDHFMAFTRKDITGGGSSSVCGMAYVGGACTRNKVSINEDQGLHCWGTAAHELGHNLGSPHDGSGNTCNPNDKNLMSPSTQMYTLTDVARSYRFSTCTAASITKYVTGLPSPNCLTTEEGTRVPQLSGNAREGTRLTLDQVCKLTFPNSQGKLMLTSDITSNPAQICASIYCLISSTSGSSSGGLRAPVGTPCGNQKTCNWNGECTPDSAAPSANESCFWGDSWDATSCNDWKNAIVKKWDTCRGGVNVGCCKTLAGLC